MFPKTYAVKQILNLLSELDDVVFDSQWNCNNFVLWLNPQNTSNILSSKKIRFFFRQPFLISRENSPLRFPLVSLTNSPKNFERMIFNLIFHLEKYIFNVFYAVFAPQIRNSGWGESQILVILAVNTPIRSVWCISYLWNLTLQWQGGIENQGGSRMWRKSWNLALQCTSLVKWCLGGDVKKWGNTGIVQKYFASTFLRNFTQCSDVPHLWSDAWDGMLKIVGSTLRYEMMKLCTGSV